MYHIHCLNKISPKGTALLTDNYAITDDRNQADGVLVRSADMHNVALPESLLAVGRAGAGVNNIPLSDCAEAGVVVFNTPGANANSVMELALCGMLLSSRDVVGGINWVQTIKDDPDIAKLVEKGKSQFAGHEIRHKNLGVIGLGAVGGPLANAARNLGMTVYGCDPFISIEAAWHLDSHIVRVNDRDEIYSKCDIISLHTPLLDDTRGMINAEAIAKMKDGVIVLNFARDLLVDDDAMAAALASGNYEVMAAVMVGGMVPPIAIALSTTFCPKKWSPDERRNGIVNYVMGLCFVSEGAIPYAATDPLRVLPSCIIGSALSGALSMVFGCALRAPHGGIFVFPVVDHALLYVVALAAGSAVGAVILSLLKKDYTAE